ncbi:MAG: FG-GAP-like repeat-containing protein, partial [Bacteroidota bacterium]
STLPTNFFVQGVSFADIDMDGHLDAYVCNDDGPSGVLIGDGQGGFTNNTTIIDTDPNGGGESDSGNYGCVWTDIDNDGDSDLYISKCRQGVSNPNDSRRINQLQINNGNGTYTEAAAAWGIADGEQSWAADFGDIDNDGDMDLVLAQHTGTFLELFRNDGNTFTDITSSLNSMFPVHPIQVKFADVDNDGWVDIIVSGTNQWKFLMNQGNGTFSDANQPAIGCQINSFALGDLNSDGFMDMYATPFGYGAWAPSGGDSIYVNDGNANNHAVFTLDGNPSNPDAVGARVEINGAWGTQIREVRAGESYGIQNTLNLHFGLGTATNIDTVTVYWPSGNVEQYFNVAPGMHHYIEGPVAIEEEVESGVKAVAFPSPATDQVLLKFENLETTLAAYEVQIYDLQGKVLRSVPMHQANKVVVPRDGLSAGLYFFALKNGNTRLLQGKFQFQ